VDSPAASRAMSLGACSWSGSNFCDVNGFPLA
jgi:hypothetical protein